VKTSQRALRERLTIVTDAVAALGSAHGPQSFGRTEVQADAAGVRRSDGTLAGSDLAMDQGVRNLVAFTECTAAEAVHAASTAPAALLGDTHRGHLEPGARADLVVLTRELHLVSTYIGGDLVHDARWGHGTSR
jgi:N-acetylglucosamine-6-phosphate deacetylase